MGIDHTRVRISKTTRAVKVREFASPLVEIIRQEKYSHRIDAQL
jgi:hypothetical protein